MNNLKIELYFLERISKIEYNIFDLIYTTKKGKMVLREELFALYDCQLEKDKKQMPIISNLYELY